MKRDDALAHAAHTGARGQHRPGRRHRLRRGDRRARALPGRLQQPGTAVARARRVQRRAPQLAAAAAPPGAGGPPRADHERGRPLLPRHPRRRVARRLQRGPAPHRRLQPHDGAPRARAPRGRPRRAARAGAGALAHRPGPPRRGQPGAHRHPAAPPGHALGRSVAPRRRALRDQAARHPGDGGAAAPGARAAPDRARRPRPRARAGHPDRHLRRAHRHPHELHAPHRRRCRCSPTRSSS